MAAAVWSSIRPGWGLGRARGGAEEVRGEAERLWARGNQGGMARDGRNRRRRSLCSDSVRPEREEGEGEGKWMRPHERIRTA